MKLPPTNPRPSILALSLDAALAGEDLEPDFAEDYEVDRSRVRVEFPAKLRGLWQPKRFKVMYGGRGGAKSWSVAMALLATEHAIAGATVNVDIRGKIAPFDIVELPFYKREK